MSDTTSTLAALAERQVLASLAEGGSKPLVAVEDLRREEIVALVERMRARANTPPVRGVRTVVSVNEPWPELRDEERVPRPGTTTVTLRNDHEGGVVLLVYDQNTEGQSWGTVPPISDGTLLADAESREALLRHLREEASALLFDALEGVHRLVDTGDGRVAVRTWVRFVAAVVNALSGNDSIGAPAAHEAIGTALPELGLFADHDLAAAAPTDRARRLRANRDATRALRDDTDDRQRETFLDKLSETPFARADGTPESDSAPIVAALRRLLRGTDTKPGPAVAYRHWRQLSDAGTTRAGLGTRLRDRVLATDPERVDEFDGLDVGDDIDAGEESAARRLLEAESEGREPLTSLLTGRQVTALERMAAPRAPRTTAPLASLLRLVSKMVDGRRETLEPTGETPAHLIVEPRDPSEAGSRHSRAAFAWLFGATLARVAEQVKGETVTFEVHPSLLDREALAELEDDTKPDDDAPEKVSDFGPLGLVLKWRDGAGAEERLEWRPDTTPGLIALPRLAAEPDRYRWAPDDDVSLDDWLDAALAFGRLPGGHEPDESTSGIVRRWLDRRREGLDELRREGLGHERLADHAARMLDLLQEVRADHVPEGGPRKDVAAVLSVDVCRCSDGDVLLATHPTRLRWIGTYLERLDEHLVDALRGTLLVNEVNSELYFDTLHALSPLDQPAIATFDGNLCVATRDEHWHQVFAPLKDQRGERRDWLAELDDGVIDEIAASVWRYLDAYPHKADGLHLLYFVRPNGARGLHRLVSDIRRQTARKLGIEGATLELTLYVAAGELTAVDELLQELDDPDHREHSDRPPVRATVRLWQDPGETLPSVGELDPTIDVAVVPNLFGANTVSRARTIGGNRGSGRFDPLLDPPTELVSAGDGRTPSDAVSRVLIPSESDAMLDAWSTVVTRQFQGEPVERDAGRDALDHVTVRVSLGAGREFFESLHDCAHWVVTVDAFVGREQIEALEGGAEVIQVRSGVGANGGYRLVTSSRHGRAFVVGRLQRRLEDARAVNVAGDRRAIAETVYRRARLLVPEIVLRSLGLGRTAAEMIGLVIARTRVDQRLRTPTGELAFESWLSLDEHAEWSGGARGTRADLVRLRGYLREGRLHLAVHVVEAKMRVSFDVGRAESQIERSVKLLHAAFGRSDKKGVEHADAPMWRRLICRAVEQASAAADATPAATHVLRPDGPSARLDPRLRAALREGSASDTTVTVDGVLVSLAREEDAHDHCTPRNGYEWLRMSEREARALLEELSEESAHPLLPVDGGDTSSDYEADEPDIVARSVAPALDSTRDTVSAVATDVEANREPAALDSEPVVPKESAATFSTADPNAELPTPPPEAPARGGRSKAAIARMQALLDALHARGVEASPAGEDDALEGPGFYLLRVALAGNRRVRDVTALSDDLQYDLELDAGRLPRIYVDRGAVVVEIPKREEERYYVDAEDLWRRTEWPEDKLYAPLGVDVRDRPVGIDFSSSRSPHLLVGGMTGGGKSVALEALLTGLVRHNDPSRLELRIVDPKGNEFTRFEGTAHVPEVIGMDAEDAIAMLERTCEEMDARYASMKTESRKLGTPVRDIASYNEVVDEDGRFKWIVIVLDEFADLTSDKDDRKAIEALLQRISQKARACGIHAIVATQKPSAEVISTTTRSNLGAQLALRVRGQSDSRVIMETSGAESLAGNGDAFLRMSGEEPIRLQCARVG